MMKAINYVSPTPFMFLVLKEQPASWQCNSEQCERYNYYMVREATVTFHSCKLCLHCCDLTMQYLNIKSRNFIQLSEATVTRHYDITLRHYITIVQYDITTLYYVITSLHFHSFWRFGFWDYNIVMANCNVIMTNWNV